MTHLNGKLEDQFAQITSFLKKYQSVYDVEYLKKYPSPYEEYISLWLSELKNWSLKDLAELESHPCESKVRGLEFKEFLKQIKKLTDIEKISLKETKLPQEYLRKLNTKKRHEVQILKTFVQNHSKSKTMIDIGGGAGHLTCALLESTDLNSICVDMNSKLQESGEKKIKRWHPEIKHRVVFVESYFQSGSKIKENFNEKESSMIGLHSCGPLSVSLMEFGVQNKISEIISLGCCYHKLKGEYNLSAQSKKMNLKLSNNSLHLAGRSAAIVNEIDLQKRLRIKSYRYALHYFLYDNYQIDFYSVGNSHHSDFDKSFAEYAKKYHIGKEFDLIDDIVLNSFYENKKTQEKIKRNFLADIIRMMFGRVIEIYLLLDRALYLKDNGHDVEVFEIFKRELSPRNIMVFSRKN